MSTENESAERPRTPFEEKRFKILSIDQRFLIDVLNWWRCPPDWLALPITPELPADCFVTDVFANWSRRCIDARICSKEFEPVPECCEPPFITTYFVEFRRVPFAAGPPTPGDYPS